MLNCTASRVWKEREDGVWIHVLHRRGLEFGQHPVCLQVPLEALPSQHHGQLPVLVTHRLKYQLWNPWSKNTNIFSDLCLLNTVHYRNSDRRVAVKADHIIECRPDQSEMSIGILIQSQLSIYLVAVPVAVGVTMISSWTGSSPRSGQTRGQGTPCWQRPGSSGTLPRPAASPPGLSAFKCVNFTQLFWK